jgi:hypothetical protein
MDLLAVDERRIVRVLRARVVLGGQFRRHLERHRDRASVSRSAATKRVEDGVPARRRNTRGAGTPKPSPHHRERGRHQIALKWSNG